MKSLRWSLLSFAVAFLLLPIGSGNAIHASGTLSDSDNDGIADENDICPTDASNSCAEAQFCQRVKDERDLYEGGASKLNWLSFIAALLAIVLAIPSAGASLFAGLYSLVSGLMGLFAGSQIDKLLEDSGCNDKLGWT